MMISNIGRLTRDKVRAKVHYSSSFLGSRGIYRVQGCRVIRTVHTRRSKERKHCGVVANDKSKNAKRRWPTLITMLLKGAHTHSFCRVTAFSYTIAATELAINEVSTERKRELFFSLGAGQRRAHSAEGRVFPRSWRRPHAGHYNVLAPRVWPRQKLMHGGRSGPTESARCYACRCRVVQLPRFPVVSLKPSIV